jgi:hypothetical protein
MELNLTVNYIYFYKQEGIDIKFKHGWFEEGTTTSGGSSWDNKK